MLAFRINVIISTKSLPGYLMQRELQNLCRRTACVVIHLLHLRVTMFCSTTNNACRYCLLITCIVLIFPLDNYVHEMIDNELST